MIQQEAVKKKMLDLRLFIEDYKTHDFCIVPTPLLILIRKAFAQMYAAGYDQSRRDMVTHYNQARAVNQYTAEMKFVQSYPSLNNATLVSGFCKDTIYRSLQLNKPIRGYIWKYINDPSNQYPILRDHLMY